MSIPGEWEKQKRKSQEPGFPPPTPVPRWPAPPTAAKPGLPRPSGLQSSSASPDPPLFRPTPAGLLAPPTRKKPEWAGRVPVGATLGSYAARMAERGSQACRWQQDRGSDKAPERGRAGSISAAAVGSSSAASDSAGGALPGRARLPQRPAASAISIWLSCAGGLHGCPLRSRPTTTVPLPRPGLPAARPSRLSERLP